MTKNKIVSETDMVSDLTKEIGNTMSNFYDKLLLQSIKGASDLDNIMFGKIVGYKKVKVPKYLSIKIPVISKSYDNDSEYGTGEFEGYLISFKKINLFQIGNTIEKVPIRRKPKGQTVTWSRYEGIK